MAAYPSLRRWLAMMRSRRAWNAQEAMMSRQAGHSLVE